MHSCWDPSSCRFKAHGTTPTQPIQRSRSRSSSIPLIPAPRRPLRERPSRAACRLCRAAWTSCVPPTGSCLPFATPPPQTMQAPPRSTLWLREAMAPLRPDHTLKFKRKGKYLLPLLSMNVNIGCHRAIAQSSGRHLKAFSQKPAVESNHMQACDSSRVTEIFNKQSLWRPDRTGAAFDRASRKFPKDLDISERGCL
jgi:hypothetical protein